MASNSVSRIVSGNLRELTEKKSIVVDNLNRLREEEKKHQQEDQDDEEEGGGKATANKEETDEKKAEDDAPLKKTIDIQPAEALKVFFDRVPLSSIPGINNEGVLELTSGDTIGEAIKKLYKEFAMGAPVRDEAVQQGDPYIGLVELSSMVLWVLEELETLEEQARTRGFTGYNADARFEKEEGEHAMESEGFFKSIEQQPSLKYSKVVSMARSFRWGPFLPVQPEDTLLHALLTLSKHTLKAVPVHHCLKAKVVGFITQDAALRLLLQCAGLEWFDAIADKKLSEFKFEIDLTMREVVHVKSDEPIFNAMMCMWKHRLSGVPVIDADSKQIIGHIRTTDVQLLLDDPSVFEKRRVLPVADFMKLDLTHEGITRCDEDGDLGVVISAGSLHLKVGWRTKMTQVVTCKRDETLKSVMHKLVKARGECSFLVNDEMQITGVITLRDIIIQFAPPLADFVDGSPGFFHT